MKIEIQMWETVTYTRRATASIGLPEHVQIQNVDDFLDGVEKGSETAEDVTEQLKDMGCTITQVDYCHWPTTWEVEITDYEEI